MQNKGLWVGVGAAIVALVALVLALRTPVSVFVASDGAVKQVQSEQRFGGTTGLDSLALKGDLSVDGTSTLTGAVTQSGALTLSSTLKVGSTNGTAIDLLKLTNATINADSIGNGSVTTSLVTVTGASTGDFVSVSYGGGSPTSSVVVTGAVTAADTVTLTFQNTSSSAVNLGNATYQILMISP